MIKLNSDRSVRDISGVAYLAHPYGGKQVNQCAARLTQIFLMWKYRHLSIVNGIDNGQAFIDDREEADKCGGESVWDETAILEADFQIINICDFLILAEGWEESLGCRAEWAYAKAKRKTILRAEDVGPRPPEGEPLMWLLERGIEK